MEAEFKSIILLLTTQAMINLGEIKDPINNSSHTDKNNSALFISLLEELRTKTRGNLTEAEEKFLDEVLVNLNRLFQDKFKEGLEQ